MILTEQIPGIPCRPVRRGGEEKTISGAYLPSILTDGFCMVFAAVIRQA